MLIFAVISFIESDVNQNVSFEQLYLMRLPWGIGLACFFIPLITLSLSGLQADRCRRIAWPALFARADDH